MKELVSCIDQPKSSLSNCSITENSLASFRSKILKTSTVYRYFISVLLNSHFLWNQASYKIYFITIRMAKLTYFMPLVSFFTTWNHQSTPCTSIDGLRQNWQGILDIIVCHKDLVTWFNQTESYNEILISYLLLHLIC